MTERRFTSHPDLDPTAVRSLAPDHLAMVEDRTLFPSTVVDVTADTPDRLLVSGANNRKLGATIIKGTYAGYSLYGLSLEERATCPVTCSVRGYCYGNGMQMARRHRIGDLDVFHDRLTIEIEHLIRASANGLMVRLHVLGDFPSIDYVAMWADLLTEHPKLACYGYTHRLPKRHGSDVGDAIAKLKVAQPNRFRIRWSSDTTEADSARVISYVPKGVRVEQGVVCPAQTKEDACCASCTFCWEPKSKLDNVVFILHGAKSVEVAARRAMAEISAPPRKPNDDLQEPRKTTGVTLAASAARQPSRVDDDVLEAADEPSLTTEKPAAKYNQEYNSGQIGQADPEEMSISSSSQEVEKIDIGDARRVGPISIPSKIKPAVVAGNAPVLRMVAPLDLLVEPAYQRDLSGRSVTLIRKIVSGWDWAKFKPPLCAETAAGLFVIDGQHTAIAAASHPAILRIPVMVVGAEHVEARAEAFVAHNRDRLSMSPLQIFHAEVAAGNADAVAIMAVLRKVGATVPRAVPMKDQAEPGQIIAINEVRATHRAHGAGWLERVIRIAVMSNVQPIGTTVVRALRMLLSEQRFSDAARMADAEIAAALGSIANVERAAQAHASSTGQGRYRACVMLILDAAQERRAA